MSTLVGTPRSSVRLRVGSPEMNVEDTTLRTERRLCVVAIHTPPDVQHRLFRGLGSTGEQANGHSNDLAKIVEPAVAFPQ